VTIGDQTPLLGLSNDDSGSSTANAGSKDNGKTIIEIVSKFVIFQFILFLFCAVKKEFNRTYSFEKT
jgi:hypothetical protein